MPIELDTVASRPFIRHGSPIESSSRSGEDRRVLGARVGADAAAGTRRRRGGRRDPRAARSASGAPRPRAAPGRRVAWPSDSLTGLKPSRSMNRIARRWRAPSACCTAWASMPSNISRFGSPVRPSRKLRRCSSVSARRSDRRKRASSTEKSRPTIRIAHAPTEASRTSVGELSRSTWSEPVCSARPAAPRTSCWLATRLTPKTSAEVVCQPSVAGLVRSPPRKKAPSAIMQPPAAPANAAISGRSCHSMPGTRPSGASASACVPTAPMPSATAPKPTRPGVATRPLTAPRPARLAISAAVQTPIVPRPW